MQEIKSRNINCAAFWEKLGLIHYVVRTGLSGTELTVFMEIFV